MTAIAPSRRVLAHWPKTMENPRLTPCVQRNARCPVKISRTLTVLFIPFNIMFLLPGGMTVHLAVGGMGIVADRRRRRRRVPAGDRQRIGSGEADAGARRRNAPLYVTISDSRSFRRGGHHRPARDSSVFMPVRRRHAGKVRTRCRPQDEVGRSSIAGVIREVRRGLAGEMVDRDTRTASDPTCVENRKGPDIVDASLATRG